MRRSSVGEIGGAGVAQGQHHIVRVKLAAVSEHDSIASLFCRLNPTNIAFYTLEFHVGCCGYFGIQQRGFEVLTVKLSRQEVFRGCIDPLRNRRKRFS